MTNAEIGKLRAAAYWLTLDVAQTNAATELAASSANRLERAFCGPENDHGRQDMRIVSQTELEAYRANRA